MSNDAVNSRPYTIAQSDKSEITKFVTVTGNNANSNCLEVFLRKQGDVSNLITKIGTYNFKGSFNPTWIPPRQETYTDYSATCPDGWQTSPDNGCVNLNYTGPKSCNAGRTNCQEVTISEPYSVTVQTGTKPGSNFSSYSNWDKQNWAGSCNASWTLKECPDGWTKIGQDTCQAYWGYWGPCSYVSGFGGYGYWDKINWGNYCNATWSYNDCPDNWTNSSNGCCAPSNYQGNCNGCQPIYSQQTRYNFRKDNQCKTEPASFFNSEMDKKMFENSCGVKWQQKQRTIPGYWVCAYGRSVADEIKDGNVVKVGDTSDDNIFSAALIALNNNKFPAPRFFAVFNGQVYVGKDGKGDIFTSKGEYQENCKNEGKVDVYQIDESIFSGLDECVKTNNLINNVNNASEINTYVEPFRNMKERKDSRFLFLLFFIIMLVIFLWKFM